eukprot:6196830-Pleurochrysis_carterae.AAC.2
MDLSLRMYATSTSLASHLKKRLADATSMDDLRCVRRDAALAQQAAEILLEARARWGFGQGFRQLVAAAGTTCNLT